MVLYSIDGMGTLSHLYIGVDHMKYNNKIKSKFELLEAFIFLAEVNWCESPRFDAELQHANSPEYQDANEALGTSITYNILSVGELSGQF